MISGILAALLLVNPAAAAEKSGHEMSSFSPAPGLSRPLEKRVEPIPAWLLKLWAEEDKAPYADHVLTPKEKAPRETRPSAQVIDLMSVLKRSLESRNGKGSGRQPARASAHRRGPKRATSARRRRA